MTDEAHRAVERAARDGYGRLVAWLAARCRDLAVAEDAVGDALEAALRTWPETGVPDNPEAWLLTAARRKVIDRARRAKTRREATERLRIQAQEAADGGFRAGLPDRRLELMFVCAHPEIDEAIRTPLMLQTVLGLSAERIAGAMLVKPATMGQRLSRAKARIAEAGLAFTIPEADAFPERLGHVLDAIYAAYGTGWEATGDGGAGTGLAHEAIWLAQLVVQLLPDAAEAKGLYALMLYCEARREARRSEDGAFVPLPEQDPRGWDHELILEAERALWLAAKAGPRGPYQLEAAIQSLHAHRARSGQTDWRSVNGLYAVLVHGWPSLGAWVGFAASFEPLGRPAEGLAILDRLPAEATARHQPYWAVRAHLLAADGRVAEARAAYERAAGLSEDPAVRVWLLARRPETG